jgi:hypothetical protein
MVEDDDAWRRHPVRLRELYLPFRWRPAVRRSKKAAVDGVRHEPFVGRRLHEESIRLQQGLALTPLPIEQPRDHPLLRVMAALLAAIMLIALALVLLPPGS